MTVTSSDNLFCFTLLFLTDFDRKLAAMGFDLSDEQASDDVKKGQQKSSSESSGEESSCQRRAPGTDKPPAAPPLPQQSNKMLPPCPPNQPTYKPNNKQPAKPGTSLYRLISQKRKDKPNIPSSQDNQNNSAKKVQFEDSFYSTEDEDLVAKKSSSSNEDDTDLGENYPSTDDMDTQDDSFESSTSAFSTDVDHPEPLPPNRPVHHVMVEDTDDDDCSLRDFVPYSVRRESILPQAPVHEVTPERSEGHSKRSQHVVAPVPSAYRHQSTTNLRAFVDDDTSCQASSTSSLNSDIHSSQDSLNKDSKSLNSTETDDEANEEEIDDFLDEALSDPEDRKQPQIMPVSLAIFLGQVICGGS